MQERPASAEGVVKDLQKNSGSEKKQPNGVKSAVSTSQQQTSSRHRLNSTPDIHGTVPLSHAPSVPPLKCSVSSTTPFAVPRVPYGSMHSHTGAYGSMHSTFPGYQSYGMAATGMPTQSAYPPTYNPYTGSTGSATAYIGNSGPPGSALYHQNARFPPSYPANPNMLNYMSYPSTDCRQVSTMLYSSSAAPYNTPPPLSTHTTSAASMYSVDGSQDLNHVPVTTSTIAMETIMPLPATTDVLTTIANSVNVPPTSATSLSPKRTPPPCGTPPVVERDCDSTTHLNTMAPLAENEEEREAAKGEKASEDPVEVLRYYATRYVLILVVGGCGWLSNLGYGQVTVCWGFFAVGVCLGTGNPCLAKVCCLVCSWELVDGSNPFL